VKNFVIPIFIAWLIALTIGEVWLFWYAQKIAVEPILAGAAAQTTALVLPSATTTVSSADFAALQTQVSLLATQVASQSAQTVDINQKTLVSKTPPPLRSSTPSRQFMITLGSGTTNSREWTATAAEVRLDPSKYAKIIGAHWEAAGSIIGGELAVRLVDLTHNTTYYDAGLVFNTSSPAWKQSSPVILATTPAVYRLEIKSSSGEIGQLHDSRLVIETQ
jgi:hypothetical protein